MTALLSRLLQRAGIRTGSSFRGYCPRNSKVLVALKKILHWAATHKSNDGVQFRMSRPTIQHLLKEHHGIKASIRCIAYALKRLVLEGYISRQTQWRTRADGTIERARTKTRLKARFLRELAGDAIRCFKLAALTWHPGGEGVVQKIADGYFRYLSAVVPRPG